MAAELVESVLDSGGVKVTKINAAKPQEDGLCDGYDLVFFGSSTWGMDSIELRDDFAALFENFASINAAGKKVAVFACGDTGYDYFCGTVDVIQEKLIESGATVPDSLKIDGNPRDEQATLEDWARPVLAAAG